MTRLKGIRDFGFALANGFRGAAVRLDTQVFRLDEQLRRWDTSSERTMFREMKAVLGPGDTVLDVGANFGLHSLIAGSVVGPQGRVYAFEPAPVNLRLLKRNIRLNALDDRVEVEPAAISNVSSEFIDFFVPSDEIAVTASLKPHGAADSVRVRNHRLDDWAQGRAVCPKLVKIDVEGAEMDVLMGAEQVLRRHHPILLIEIHGFALPSFGHSETTLKAFLADLGYREKRLTNPSDRPDYYQSLFSPG